MAMLLKLSSPVRQLLALTFGCMPLLVNAQAGALDMSFSGDGIVTVDVGGNDVLQAITLDEDQNIYAAGYAVVGAGPYKDICVAKFTPDGVLDPVFGGDGIVTTDLGANFDDLAYAIAMQPDGKIVVAGSSYDGTGNKMCILRYRADGSLDPAFSSDGKLIIDFGGPDDAARGIIIMNDGSIYVGGYRMEEVTATMFRRNFAAVRVTTTGEFDAAFGGDGKVATLFSEDRHASGFSMGVQSDGKVIMAGYSYVGTSANYQYALVRYNTDGSLDNTFDGDGMVLVPTGTSLGEAYGIQIQIDNKIVIAGKAYEGFDTDFSLIRFNENGSLDNTFGTGGVTQITYGTGEEESFTSLAMEWDGGIVAAGYKGNGTDRETVIMRFLSNGTLDPAFGTGGKVNSNFSPEADQGYAVIVQPDGKFLVAGFSDGGVDNDLAVMRYLSDPGSSIQNFETKPLEVAPNPCSSYITCTVPVSGSLMVYDVTGKLLQVETVQPGNVTLSFIDMPVGVYTLKLESAAGVYTQQIIKR